MTLQRVDRVELQNWRNWQGPLILDDLPSGIVVLAGPNALGKTGVWEAVVAALLDRHWGTHTDRLRPAGTKGVLPRVQVDFRADGRRYRVEKHFGAKDRAEFHEWVDGKWVLRDGGEEAYLLCRKAVLGGDESAPLRGGPDKALSDTLMEVLLAAQGRLADGTPAPGAVSIAVTDRDAADTATRLGRILDSVGRDCDEIWVKKRTVPKKGTALASGRERLAAIEAEIPGLQDRAHEIDRMVTQLGDIVAEEHDREEAEAQNREAGRLRAQAKEHREKCEAARKMEEAARREKEEVERLCEAREALRKALVEAKEQAETSARREKEAAADLDRRESESRKAMERRDRLEAEVACFRDWFSHEERGGRLVHLGERLEGIRGRLERLETAEKEIADRQAEIGSLLLPTAGEWTEWDELQAKWSRAEGALKAGAWKVRGQVPGGLTLTLDGAEVNDDPVDAEATRDVVVADGHGAVLSMEAPRDLAEKLDVVVAEVRSFFGRFDVADITELRNRNEYVQTDLRRRLALAEQMRDDALGDGDRNDLLRAQVELTSRIEKEEAGSAPESERPEGRRDLWEARLKSLSTDLGDARVDVESLQGKLGSAREHRSDAKRAVKARHEDLGVADAALSGHRAEYGPDEDLLASRAKWRTEHKGLLAEWERLDDARAMAETAKEERAERLSAELGGILARDREVQKLEAAIDARRSEDPAAKLAALTAERAGLTARVRSEEVKADALLLLERALIDEKQQVTQAIGEPVRERVQKWVAYLLQDDSRVVVDEDGRPVVVRTPAGREVPLEDQSFGTREQMSVLYRLAVADLVAAEADSGVCLMLDDPFGHTDRLRRGRMLEILTAASASRGHQVLLFTCRPEDFKGVGHPVSLTEPSTPSA